MVISEIDGIISNLTKKTIEKEATISLKDIKGKEIPNFIKNYFDREAEKWIREEASMFLSSGRFNYDLPDVRKKFDELYELLKNTAIFNRPKLMRVMEQAVKLQTNFLIQPERTMVQFVYRDDDVITPAEVMDSMKYFLDYEYYYKALEHYFQTNQMDTISRAKFKNFVQQLDEKALSQNTAAAASNVAKVIVGFLNLGRDTQSDTLESEILVQAYQDRNLTEFVGAVKQAAAKGAAQISVSKLDGLFKAYLEGAAAAARPAEAEFLKTTDLTKKVGAGIDSVIYEEKKEVVSTDNLSTLVSQIEEFEEEETELTSVDFLEEEEEEDIVLPPPPPPPKVEEKPKAEAKPAVKAKPAAGEVSVADQMADAIAGGLKQASVLEDLYQLIEDKDKKHYIKKLFKKKDKEFFDLLNALNAFKTWKEANDLIEETFYRLEVNPYQKEAIDFTDKVYSRYFAKD